MNLLEFFILSCKGVHSATHSLLDLDLTFLICKVEIKIPSWSYLRPSCRSTGITGLDCH